MSRLAETKATRRGDLSCATVALTVNTGTAVMLFVLIHVAWRVGAERSSAVCAV